MEGFFGAPGTGGSRLGVNLEQAIHGKHPEKLLADSRKPDT
jgi:hypothetical protein